MQRINWLLVGGTIAGFVLIGVSLFILQSSGGIKLDILVAPSTGKLTLDGQAIQAGTHSLSLGKHTVKATLDGFSDSVRTVTITKQSTPIRMILIPNSDKGRQYLANHPEEQSLIEQYDGLNFSDNNAQSLIDNPILKVLPYIAGDNTYRIDVGGTEDGTGKAPIFITGANTAAVQSARTWIAQKGYDLKSLDIQQTIEPLLSKLPYKTTDYLISPDFTTTSNGSLKMNLAITIYLSGADRSDPDAATAAYKQEALDQLKTFRADLAKYTITYTVN